MSVLDFIKRRCVSIKHQISKLSLDDLNTELVNILKSKISEIDTKVPHGTSSWEQNRKQLRQMILEADLADFLNWEVIQRTMFYEAPKLEYQAVITNDMLAQAIVESRIGNPKPYFLNTQTSGNLVHHAYSVLMLLNKRRDINFESIIELGGGYGSMCRLFRNMGFNNKYVILDLPEFSALQEFYLGSIKQDFIKNTFFENDFTELMQPTEDNLLLATWSLSEMPIKLRTEILENLNFNSCVIAFQSEFDGIDNVKYFNEFIIKYSHISFELIPINHLNGHYYLIGTKLS